MQDKVKGRDALARARRALTALGERAQTVEVAAATGIHQSQVSRLLRGQFKRLSPNVARLLAYAEQPTPRGKAAAPSVPSKEQAKQAVIRAALRTWDATPEGAQALVRLLRSVEALRTRK